MSNTSAWEPWPGRGYPNISDYFSRLVFDNKTNFLQERHLVPTVLCVSVMILFAVGGNLLVLLSYAKDPRLRTVSNVYVCHLAVCDFLLGAVSMTLYLYLTVVHDSWQLGPVFCKIYLMNDYTLCAQSAFLVVLISLDKLLILRKGIRYVTEETKRKAYARIGLAWLLAAMLYSPAILIWDYCVGYSVLGPHQCDTEFHANHVFTLTTAVIEFAGPLIALVVINTCVYLEIRKRISNRNKNKELAITARDVQQQQRLQSLALGRGDRRSRSNETGRGDPVFVLFPGQGGETCQMEAIKDNNEKNSGCCEESTSEEDSSWFHGSTEDNTPQSTPNVDQTSKNEPSLPDSSCKSIFRGHPRKKVEGTDPKTQEAEAVSSLSEISSNNPSSACRTDVNTGVTAENSQDPRFHEAMFVPSIPIPEDPKQHVQPYKLAKTWKGMPRIKMNILGKKEPGPNQTASPGCQEKLANRKLLNPNALKLRKDFKAARNLFVFIFTFVLCWAPYTISTIIIAYCQDSCVGESAHQLFTWLLWLKSSINPFLYAASSFRFRSNFARILGNLFFCCPRLCERLWLSSRDVQQRYAKT